MITLKQVMKANALSCIFFGVLFITLPTDIALFLSQVEPAPAMVLTCLGIILVVNGLHIIWTSLSQIPNKFWVIYFSLGDFLWVFASLYLMVSGTWIASELGIAVATAIAIMVGVFGILQLTKSGAENMARDAI